jgi:hypothetical protein
MLLVRLDLRWLFALGAAVFLVNPSFACMSDGDDFQYGAVEMRAAVEGTWQATFAFNDGSQGALTFSLQQGAGTPRAAADLVPARRGSLVRPAMACASRELVRAAAACLSVTTMPLDGAYVSGDERYAATKIAGTLEVPSTVFTTGMLTLLVGDGIKLTSSVSPTGEVTELAVWDPNGGVLGTATLARLTR